MQIFLSKYPLEGQGLNYQIFCFAIKVNLTIVKVNIPNAKYSNFIL